MNDYICPECGHGLKNHSHYREFCGETDYCQCKYSKSDIYASILSQQAQALAEAREALKPFAHEDLCKVLGGNVYGEESIFFQRDKAILRLKDTNRAAEWLKKYP